MNVLLWIVAGLLALAFLGAGLTKVSQPKDKLAGTMGWVDDFSPAAVKTIGALEVLGAIGLVLPALVDVAPVLVPVAATGLAVTMVGTIVVHLRRHEPQMVLVNVVLLVLALLVAVLRFGPYAF